MKVFLDRTGCGTSLFDIVEEPVVWVDGPTLTIAEVGFVVFCTNGLSAFTVFGWLPFCKIKAFFASFSPTEFVILFDVMCVLPNVITAGRHSDSDIQHNTQSVATNSLNEAIFFIVCSDMI